MLYSEKIHLDCSMLSSNNAPYIFVFLYGKKGIQRKYFISCIRAWTK